MPEADHRSCPPQRGRGVPRGRGGYTSARSGASVRSTTQSPNGNANVSYNSTEDQGGLDQLRKKYGTKLKSLEEMFCDWTAENLVLALEENNGDLEDTVAKISEGSAVPWEVKGKPKEQSKPRAQDRSSTGATTDSGRGPYAVRGGSDALRSNRGRVAPRARGANGTARPSKDFTEEHPACEAIVGTEAENVDEPRKKPESGSTTTSARHMTYASVVAKMPMQKKAHIPLKQVSPPLAPAPEPQAVPEPKEPEPAVEVPPPQGPIAELPATPQAEVPAIIPIAEPEPESEPEPEPELEPEPEVKLEVPVVPAVLALPAVPTIPAVPAVSTIPAVPEAKETVPSSQSQQPLTEVNLEKAEDVAPPAPATTQSSTIASPAPASIAAGSIAPPPTQPVTTTPRTLYAGVVMPSKMTPKLRPRTLVQQEPVIMPSSHNVMEHGNLQFGSMGPNGDIDDEDESEQAETVSQPPQPSPIAQPVAALPPSQLPVSQPPITEVLPTLRQAPGLPVHPQTAPQQPSPQPPLAPQGMAQQQHPNQHMPGHYNRYEVPNPQQQPQVKPFDTFGPHAQQQSTPQPQTQPQQSQAQPPQSQPQAYASYTPSQLPHQQPSHIGVGVSTTPDQQHQYSNYYDRTQPPGFGNLYNSSYMQQGQSQQDAGASQQRASSGLGGAGEVLGQVPTSAPAPGQVQQPTSRYSTAQAGEQSSGHATPSPAITAAQQTSQHHQPGLAQYPGGMPAYGYQHPYYNQYMHQNYYNHPNSFGKHQGMYGYPQAYMSPQYSDHSSTPAGLGGFTTPSTQGRESVGLGDYGRMNATASQQQQQQSLPQHSSTGAYGNSNNIPSFLNSRGLSEQLSSGVGQQQVTQQAQSDESMKFGENKPPTGPSSTPLIPGQPGRPGSATNGANMGPQHGAQTQAMYSTHLNHSLHGQPSQYGVGQGQSATSQFPMYGYPPYTQSTQRHTGNWNGGYGH